MRLFRYSFVTHSCISFLRKVSQELAVKTFQSRALSSLYRSLYFPVSLIILVSLVAQLVNNLPAMQETPVRILGREDPLEKG